MARWNTRSDGRCRKNKSIGTVKELLQLLDRTYFDRDRYDTAFAALRKNRAKGFDAVALEAYAASPDLKDELYRLTHAL